ncbi:hypothetical protein WJX72_009117 [[Myrmecia] bisecta]|uniref:Uncharacterized protein n=1 Tax=[Myrmecia] bisecta TaxID=41462 RepID=A0AAW1QSS4_9CHLO
MERQVDLAYDVLFMQDLKKRIGGQVSGSVRFADVPKPKRKPASQGPMQSLPGGVRVDKPANNTLVAQSAVFGALAAWSLFQGVSEPASVAASDVAGLQLALATGAAVYFLRENKRLKLGRAAGLASAGLVLGVLLGSGLQAWLRVDVVPLAGLSSPGVFVSGFAILGLWASCTFLI